MAKRAQNIDNHAAGTPGEPVDKVFTLANCISFVRLLMAPVSLGLLLCGHDLPAALLFAIAASTDFVDGQIARRTHTVSKLGQLLDPAVDRLLMICSVVGLLVMGRLPAWIVILVLVRDILLLMGQSVLLGKGIRVAVIYPGKVATTLLFVGIAGLLLNAPLVPGLGLVDLHWLPGFGCDPCSWGIWFIYAGTVLGVFTTIYYAKEGLVRWMQSMECE